MIVITYYRKITYLLRHYIVLYSVEHFIPYKKFGEVKQVIFITVNRH